MINVKSITMLVVVVGLLLTSLIENAAAASIRNCTKPVKNPSYQAIAFTPKSSLVTLHNTVRLYGVNTVPNPDSFATVTSMQGDSFNYLVGLLAPAIAMIIVFVGWLISLCCAKLCCQDRLCCKKNFALLLFIIFGGCSIAAWIAALSANAITSQGFEKLLGGVDNILCLADNTLGLVNTTNQFIDNMINLTGVLNDSCQNNASIPFPLGEMSNALNEAKNAVGSTSNGTGVLGQVNNIMKDIDKYMGLVRGYLQWREVGTMIILLLLLFVVSLFVISTALRVMDSTPDACHKVARCTSHLSAVVVFVFGILLLLIMWIFLAIIHIIVTGGADICVPSPNYNINRLIASVTNGTSSPLGRRMLDSGYLDITAKEIFNARVLEIAEEFRMLATYQEDPAYPVCQNLTANSTQEFICFFQFCEGTNKLLEMTDPIRNKTSEGNATLQAFRDNVTALSGFLGPECVSEFDNYLGAINGAGVLLNEAFLILECSTINPVYASLLYDGMCNGLIDGLYFSYVTMILGCVFLMLSMSIFRVFNFAAYQDGRLPEEYYDGVDDGGGKVVNRASQ